LTATIALPLLSNKERERARRTRNKEMRRKIRESDEAYRETAKISSVIDRVNDKQNVMVEHQEEEEEEDNSGLTQNISIRLNEFSSDENEEQAFELDEKEITSDMFFDPPSPLKCARIRNHKEKKFMFRNTEIFLSHRKEVDLLWNSLLRMQSTMG